MVPRQGAGTETPCTDTCECESQISLYRDISSCKARGCLCTLHFHVLQITISIQPLEACITVESTGSTLYECDIIFLCGSTYYMYAAIQLCLLDTLVSRIREMRVHVLMPSVIMWPSRL